MICFSMVLLSAAFKAVQDTVLFHYSESILPKNNFWNQDNSWKLKWRGGDKANGEAFLGSSTVFVLFTDGFHLMQACFLLFAFLSIVLYKPMINWWADFLILRITFGVVFEIMYGKVLVKK